MVDSQVKAFYKFKGLVAEKHTSGQYLTDWVSAWKIMVIASTREEANVKAFAALGKATTGYHWVIKWGSIKECPHAGIITGLDLLKPFYRVTAQHGHFGWSYLPWEKY